MDTASITSSGLRKSSTASSILDGAINGNTNFASASPSMYSSPNSTDSTESGGSTMIGHGSQSKPTKVGKSHSSTTTSATSRGPPGSCEFFYPGRRQFTLGLIEFDSQRTIDSCRAIDGRRRDCRQRSIETMRLDGLLLST
jgi:hypothetical protein